VKKGEEERERERKVVESRVLSVVFFGFFFFVFF